jgi:hypothetical protein
MKYLSFICVFFYLSNVFSQTESQAPLTANPDLFVKKMDNQNAVKNSVTFDSTFIYIPDTLQLPFFDEFSKNHFQEYSAQFSDPGITSETAYRLLDVATMLPLSNDALFTGQATFRRTVDLTNSTFEDVPFSATPCKVGDFSSFPVVYTTLDLYPPYYIYDTLVPGDVSDTIWIPGPDYFQDSATQFFAILNDPNAYWLDDDVYHNYRFAWEPRSLGIATFDGLDRTGYPYAMGSAITNYADFLTSKPLDLSTVSPSDSVYFSFLFQTEGFGDVPEASDSLVLEFYAVELNQWFRMWSASGQDVGAFKIGHIRLHDQKYFKKGFQFRFKNYGSLSGMLDVFNLDYVHLRPLSGYQDTLFKDFAFSYPVGSLLKDYTSVPWDHYVAEPSGKMNDAFNAVVHNGSNLMENNQNGSLDVVYNGTVEGNFILNGQLLSGGQPNYSPNTTYTSSHDLSAGYQFPTNKVGNHQTFDVNLTASAQFPNYSQNDSTSGTQFFGNYYSYDDGSAEAAYGPTGNQARLAVHYQSYVADSLIGVNIHFVPSVNDVSNKLFLLSVWSDQGGEPGQLLYEDDVFFPRQPIYGANRNEFHTYYFSDTMKVPVGTSFFVGWRQFDADRLNVGLDKNLDNSNETYYSVDGGVTWTQSSISGSVMIRPVFSTELDGELSMPEGEALQTGVEVYPNPASETIHIRHSEMTNKFVRIVNASGEVMFDSADLNVDVSNWKKGVYFVYVEDIPGAVKFIKW